jgi:plasmid maintenance system antidote protein VapI
LVLRTKFQKKIYYDKYFKNSDQEGCCIVCGKETTFGGLSGYTKHCSYDCVHNDLEVKNRKKESMMLTCSDTEWKKKKSEISKSVNARPEMKKQLSDQSKKMWANPHIRNKISLAVKKSLSTPEMKKKLSEARILTAQDPEYIKKKSDSSKEMWKNLDYRKKLEKIRNNSDWKNNLSLKLNKIFQSEIYKKRQSEITAACWKDPIKRKNMRLGASNRMTDDVKNRIKNSLLQYYIDNPLAREKLRVAWISYIEKYHLDGDPFVPTIGKLEPEFFNFLSKFTKYKIIRLTKPFHGFYPDGYIKELNLVIEFDEPFHEGPANIKRDNIKNQCYSINNVTIFRVKEQDWKVNRETIATKFQSLIELTEKEIYDKQRISTY